MSQLVQTVYCSLLLHYFELLTVTLTGCKSLPAKSNEMCVCVSQRVLSIQSIYQLTHTESQIVLSPFMVKKIRTCFWRDYEGM